jgi:hypothetical protein
MQTTPKHAEVEARIDATTYIWIVSEKARIANRVIESMEWTVRDRIGGRFSREHVIEMVNERQPQFTAKAIVTVLDQMSDPTHGQHQRLDRHVERDGSIWYSYRCDDELWSKVRAHEALIRVVNRPAPLDTDANDL